MIQPTRPFCGECDHYHNPDEPHGTCELCDKIPPAIRERDQLWCMALINTLSMEDMGKVLQWFNEHRPD